MKQKVETVIIVMSLTVTICAHLAAVPAAIAYTWAYSSSLALVVYVVSLLVLLLPTFGLTVKSIAWAMVLLEGKGERREPAARNGNGGIWTTVHADGVRQPEVEKYVNRGRPR